MFLIAVLVINGCSKNSNLKSSPTTTPQKNDSLQTTPLWSSDADVYFAGTSDQGNRTAATYWKNGAATVLSSGDDATGIAANGNDIYVIYWRNGVPYLFGKDLVNIKS